MDTSFDQKTSHQEKTYYQRRMLTKKEMLEEDKKLPEIRKLLEKRRKRWEERGKKLQWEMKKATIFQVLKSIMIKTTKILTEVFLLLIIIATSFLLAELFAIGFNITPNDTSIILPCYGNNSNPISLMCSTKNIRSYETISDPSMVEHDHETIMLHNDLRKEKSVDPIATRFSATTSKQVSLLPTFNAKAFTTFGDKCPNNENSNTEPKQENKHRTNREEQNTKKIRKLDGIAASM